MTNENETIHLTVYRLEVMFANFESFESPLLLIYSFTKLVFFYLTDAEACGASEAKRPLLHGKLRILTLRHNLNNVFFIPHLSRKLTVAFLLKIFVVVIFFFIFIFISWTIWSMHATVNKGFRIWTITIS